MHHIDSNFSYQLYTDYKKLYEEEKSLRTQLQQKKQLENNQGAEEKMSDYDIALQAAVDVLN